MRLVTHKWILAPHDSIPNVKMLLKIVWKKRRVLTPNHCPYFACFVVPATWVLFIPTSPDYFLSGHLRVPEHSTHFLLACSGRNQVGCVCFSVPRKNRFWTSLWSLERYWYVWKVHIFVGLPVLFEVFTCIDWRKHIDTSSTCYIFVLHFR